MLKLLIKVVGSPLMLFIIGYIYYGDWKEAYYLALLGYTVLTVFSVILTAVTIIPTMAKFNIFKLVKKSYKIVSMSFALGLYWIIYLLI
ncbi:hypothetical protein JW978_04185 [Candidatus Dojkabacteria bacterium]|nr:hypothetical protein [Candidatus Dojkabacteria bacterium]